MSEEKNFIDSFDLVFQNHSYNNKLYGRICAHVLLGQVLKHIKIPFGPIYIDPRVSLFFIQPSGTGKSVAWPLIKQVGEKAQMRVSDIDDISDAGLIGTEEAEETIDPETKCKTITHNVVKGKLADSDILHYDEGQMLIKRGTYALNTLAWLQKALNPIGSEQNVCTRVLAHGEVTIRPTCSLIITSHEIENLLDTVLNTGFFQRIILYPRYVPIADRKLNEQRRADLFGQQIFTELDVEILADKLLKIAKETKEYKLKVNPKVNPVSKQYIESMYRHIENSHARVKEIMATFVPRYANIMYILSLHNSCANFKPEIDIEDVKYGGELSLGLFKEIMMWVEENISLTQLTTKEKSYMDRMYQIYYAMQKDENGYVQQIALMNLFAQRWNISKPTILRNIEKFIGYGKIKCIDKNGSRWLKFEK